MPGPDPIVIAAIVAEIIEEMGEDLDPEKIAREVEIRTFNLRRRIASARLHAEAHDRSRRLTREAVDREEKEANQ